MSGGGPLAGVKVIELGGIGPGPHAGMLLADLGADVVRVRRARRLRQTVRQPNPCRMGADLRRYRCVRHPGADADRSRDRRAPAGAVHGDHRPRRRPGRTGPALFSDTARTGRTTVGGDHAA
ncbi:MAG: hypothetical protein EPN51_18790 [Mycobacterium sp.]|nr:MAG: hypothetical protein EPN51_18790 [Mycobacterium sp.]